MSNTTWGWQTVNIVVRYQYELLLKKLEMIEIHRVHERGLDTFHIIPNKVFEFWPHYLEIHSNFKDRVLIYWIIKLYNKRMVMLTIAQSFKLIIDVLKWGCSELIHIISDLFAQFV